MIKQTIFFKVFFSESLTLSTSFRSTILLVTKASSSLWSVKDFVLESTFRKLEEPDGTENLHRKPFKSQSTHTPTNNFWVVIIVRSAQERKRSAHSKLFCWNQIQAPFFESPKKIMISAKIPLQEIFWSEIPKNNPHA